MAVDTVFFIAYNATVENPVSARYITDFYNLNERAIEPALQTLVAANIVQSQKGPNGGYYIESPEKISLWAVLSCFVDELLPENETFGQAGAFIRQPFTAAWGNFREDLEGVTLKALCEKADKTGLPRATAGDFILDFVI